MRRATSGLVLAATVFASISAWATPSSRLTYARGEGADQCPEEASLRAAVTARLGYDPFFPWAKKTIVVQIEKAARGFRGHVQIVNEGDVVLGERTLESASSDCNELVTSLALAISLAVDDLEVAPPPVTPIAPATAPTSPPEASPPEGSLSGGPSVAPAAPVAHPIPDAQVAEPSRPGAGPIQLNLWLGALGVLGMAPSPSAGAALSVGVRRAWWSLALEGRGDLSASMTLADGAHLSSSALLASLVPCAHFGVPFVCALGTVGSFRGAARGVTMAESSSAAYTGVGLRAGIELRVRAPFYVRAHVDGLATFTPHRLDLNGETFYALPVLSGALGADLGVRFP